MVDIIYTNVISASSGTVLYIELLLHNLKYICIAEHQGSQVGSLYIECLYMDKTTVES